LTEFVTRQLQEETGALRRELSTAKGRFEDELEETRAAASKAALRANEEMSQLTTKVALQVFFFLFFMGALRANEEMRQLTTKVALQVFWGLYS
jgi:hypothetical protein